MEDDNEWSFDAGMRGKKFFQILDAELTEVLETSGEDLQKLKSDLSKRVRSHMRGIKCKGTGLL